ncbi:zinc transporter 8 [Quercus suber]|uniref:zinc transporter 8 n=1 Tax=Quercus suber TaxID=58331 RepID=UPI0032DE4A7B
MAKLQLLLLTLFCVFLLLPSSAFGDCTCDTEDEGRDKTKALKYKLAAIASILVAGAIGVCIPILGKAIPALRPEKDIFFFIKAFAAGVILSTGFIYVLPDAFESLTSLCLSESPWQDFPFMGFVVMVSAIGTLMVDAFATSYYRKSHFNQAAQNGAGDVEMEGGHEGHLHVHTHATHGHAHGSTSFVDNLALSDFIQHRVISQLQESGLVELMLQNPGWTPSESFGDCTCDTEDEGRDKTQALKYKLAAIASILVAGAIGVCIPILGKTIPALRPEKDIFFFIKAFAAGVILSTGFIHVLPDAFESLTSPCLKSLTPTRLLKMGLEMWRWKESTRATYTFTHMLLMVMLMVPLPLLITRLTSYYRKSHSNQAAQNGAGDVEMEGEHEGHLHVHTHATHGHAHGSTSFVDNSASSDLIRHRVISQVLELGIVVHSVIIGISLGASESPKTIRPLVAALTFHQFFEGMGLGGCISQGQNVQFTLRKRKRTRKIQITSNVTRCS